MRGFSRFFCAFFLVLFALSAQVVLATPKTVTVFAAVSLSESLKEIAALYKKVNPDAALVFNLDSSGTLKTQIEHGAECDVFISAAQKQMDALDIKAPKGGNKRGLDFVLQGSRVDLLANSVVLIAPKGMRPKGVTSFKDLGGAGSVSLIVIANADVPAGQYAEEIFKHLHLWDSLKSERKLSFASNVREVLAQVANAAADCGVVYRTDAASTHKVEVIASAPKGSHRPIVYPAAVLKTSKNPKMAMNFITFLRTPQAQGVFKKHGFTQPQ